MRQPGIACCRFCREEPVTEGGDMPTFELIAGTFKEGETIPKPHT